MEKINWTKKEISIFKKYNSPQRIQDFINSLKFNFEKGGDTCASPRKVLKTKTAHCLEGAMLAFAMLEFHNFKPKLIDLRSVKKPYDDDHVIVVFKKFNCFGAISKTNHGVLRYREPVYKTIRELVMSFFHEYFLSTGEKTLREYSNPFDLNYFNNLNWRFSQENLFEISFHLDKIKHYKILSKEQIKNLRNADMIEIEMGKLVEYKNK